MSIVCRCTSWKTARADTDRRQCLGILEHELYRRQGNTRQQLEDLMCEVIPVKSCRVERQHLKSTNRALVEGRRSRVYLRNLVHRVV